MNSETKKENLLVRLQNILKEYNVKLWLPPYHEENSNNDSAESLLNLATQYASILNIKAEECVNLLLELQEKSLYRLTERNTFRTEGLATIRVKVCGMQTSEFSVKIKLSETTDDLKEKISNEVKVPVLKLKIISCGKVLKDGCVLEAQNVKHGNLVLALILQNNVNEDPLSETRDNQLLLEQTKQDLERLNHTTSTNKYFTITNQIGSSLDLPTVDRNILVSAMTLHEKGRSALNNCQYPLALVFFFEADAEYKKCHSDILEKVDNYGLLNLDIVWTYLHLKNLHSLTDADARLNMCENSFRRCYGENLERLNEIKGTSGNERVLFVRLHLLQGISLHYKNQEKEALSMFEKVEREIENLKVDFENVRVLSELVNCSTKTAKLALQATYNHLDAAVAYILERKEEKKLIRKQELIREFADRHTCLDGSQINLTVLKQLHDMGYTNLISTYALAASNNDINQGLLWIADFQKKLRNLYPAYVIDVFMTLEFDAKDVKYVLYQYGYELTDLCVQALIEKTAVGEEYFSKLKGETPGFVYPENNIPSTSSGIISPQEHSKLFNLEENESLGRLQNGLSNSGNSHLISDLSAEENFLKLYKSFLSQN